MAVNLPPISDLSSSVISYLNNTFYTPHDLNLSESTQLVSDLEAQCHALTHSLADLSRRLHCSLASYNSFSDRIGDDFNRINVQLDDLKSKSSFSRILDGNGGEREGLGKAEQAVAEELPALAREVARVETVRIYAETALKLDALVGDIEDAASSVLKRNLIRHPTTQISEDLRLSAINSLKLTEDILTSVAESHPQWVRLVSAVDLRADRALATLRPQVIADHRALLASFGWPPPLSTLSSSIIDATRSSEVQNPLFTMHGEIKQKYCENFLALCSLQQLQRRRKSRQLEGYKWDFAQHQPLWAVEELVNPVSLACQQHFAKWVEKPEFIFALVYKITRDYVDSMDELLQPLIDEAMLTGYSCREEWVSAMVTSLSTYLSKEIFPTYISQLCTQSTPTSPSQGRMAWLHLVDLMIVFDKRVRPLAVHSEILNLFPEDRTLQRISTLSVFSDRPDWLDLWAEIELGNALEKLEPEIEDQENWTAKTRGPVHLLGFEEYKSPAISSVFLQYVSSIIDRCQLLPTISLRSRFVRSVGAPIIQRLLDCLLTKCLEAEGLTALAGDDALIKVSCSINSARHLKSILHEWSEDVIFLEMDPKQGSQLSMSVEKENPNMGEVQGQGIGIFDAEIGKMDEFTREWVDRIITVVLRGFDAKFRDYTKGRKQWQEKVEEGLTVTQSFLTSLDYLQGKMWVLEEGLNGLDFAAVWRNSATGLDRLIFNGILMSNVKFSEDGVERFAGDMDILFGIFRPWCLRPQGFFPRVAESLKLLKMDQRQSKDLFVRGKEWMKDNGIRHLTIAEAEKVVRSRVFLN
ncbi:hypothetical protein Nepgr_019016 [Nepenthes gracilis]|uniref:RINT1-like protein MAG2 n=1 Tax=Nepenthes gracilis TaxID=150966 RepID=A0AAD3XUU3_NEPGR|nr:hypothetical protein Nepgr_019016 [Nepenthes gracilis]